ncbi:1277_t:CDS:2, partial [Paraglomus occultum]
KGVKTIADLFKAGASQGDEFLGVRGLYTWVYHAVLNFKSAQNLITGLAKRIGKFFATRVNLIQEINDCSKPSLRPVASSEIKEDCSRSLQVPHV